MREADLATQVGGGARTRGRAGGGVPMGVPRPPMEARYGDTEEQRHGEVAPRRVAPRLRGRRVALPTPACVAF